MVSQTPTFKQRRLIKRWKIPVPTTKDACSRLIDFLLEDQKQIGQRVRQVRGLHSRFRGARVQITDEQSEYRGQRGTVQALRMRSGQELADIAQHLHNTDPYLYVAVVVLDSDGQPLAHVCLSGLKVLIRGDQSRLAFSADESDTTADV